MPVLPLEGLVIGVTADRRRDEQAALLKRRGASVVHGPTIASRYLEQDSELRHTTAALIAEPPEYLVANTGIGMRGWLDAAQAWNLGEELVAALSRTRIFARGPKAAAVVQTHGLTVCFRAPNERLDEVAEALARESLSTCRVVVQEHGDSATEFTTALRERGATVVELPIYRWHVPEDPTAACRLVDSVCAGRVDAVTFTSAPAVHNLFAIAETQGTQEQMRRAFNHGVVAGCVGSVCADAAQDLGIDAPVWPPTGRLGLLVRELSDHFGRQRITVHLAGMPVEVQGTLVAMGDGTKATLTPRERGVFEALLVKPGAVVSRTALLQRVWGSGAHDPHALEMTVARLRTKLGPCRDALHTVAGRGYRLDPS